MVNLVTPKQHLLMPVLYGRAYWKKVLNIDYANLILYHPMNEAAGAIAIDKSSQGNDGAYTGVTLGQAGIGDGSTCPLFDGTNDFNEIYSAGFAADFDGEEGTFAGWMKVSGVGAWTDGSHRRVVNILADANNQLNIYKNAGNNIVTWTYKAGGATKTANAAGHSETGWIHVALTWSKAADEAKYYENGSQVGATLNGLGAWVGAPIDNNTVIGATNVTPANVWDGWLAHCAIWKTPLSASDILKVGRL